MADQAYNTVITDPGTGHARLTWVGVDEAVAIGPTQEAWGIVDPSGQLVSVRSEKPLPIMGPVEALARSLHAEKHPTFEFDPLNRENTDKLRECYCMALADELHRNLGDLRFRLVPIESLDDGRRP